MSERKTIILVHDANVRNSRECAIRAKVRKSRQNFQPPTLFEMLDQPLTERYCWKTILQILDWCIPARESLIEKQAAGKQIYLSILNRCCSVFKVNRLLENTGLFKRCAKILFIGTLNLTDLTRIFFLYTHQQNDDQKNFMGYRWYKDKCQPMSYATSRFFVCWFNFQIVLRSYNQRSLSVRNPL